MTQSKQPLNFPGRFSRYPTATSTDQTYAVFDEAAHVVGVYDVTGTRIQEVIWLGDIPVGVIANNALHYVQADHLGTPRVIIDPVREKAVWRWDLADEAFGTTAPNQYPDVDGSVFVFDLRFPGQRYDAASGLNYNYFRDYEPGSGRYVQSDPIGLDGGISTYSFVGSAPLGAIDPYGLAAIEIPLPAVPPQVAPWLVAASRILGPVAATLSLSGSTPQECQNHALCEKAKGEARYAYNVLMSKRIPQFQSGGRHGRDANHLETISQWQMRLKKKLASVRRHCVPLPAEYAEWSRAANLNAPGF